MGRPRPRPRPPPPTCDRRCRRCRRCSRYRSPSPKRRHRRQPYGDDRRISRKRKDVSRASPLQIESIRDSGVPANFNCATPTQIIAVKLQQHCRNKATLRQCYCNICAVWAARRYFFLSLQRKTNSVAYKNKYFYASRIKLFALSKMGKFYIGVPNDQHIHFSRTFYNLK